MPVTQIDKNGFISGTKSKYKMKVKALQPIMVKGVYHPKDDVVELEGADLAMMLNSKQVVPFIEEAKVETAAPLSTETQPDIVAGKEKKLGSKKSKKEK